MSLDIMSMKALFNTVRLCQALIRTLELLWSVLVHHIRNEHTDTRKDKILSSRAPLGAKNNVSLDAMK